LNALHTDEPCGLLQALRPLASSGGYRGSYRTGRWRDDGDRIRVRTLFQLHGIVVRRRGDADLREIQPNRHELDSFPVRQAWKGRQPVVKSSTGARVPEGEWLSTAALEQVVDESVQQFQMPLPIGIIDRVVDVLPADPAGANDNAATSGFNYTETIYLVRERLPDRAEVLRTLWHELLHFGLRRFVSRAQYIPRLKDLYQRDTWISAKAHRREVMPRLRPLTPTGRALCCARYPLPGSSRS
jgi:hypothetical protein